MTDIHLGQPTGAEFERVRARFRRWNRRRYIAWGAFGAVALLAFLANALAVDWLHFLVPLAIWLLLLAGANSSLWWRCPRCFTSFTQTIRLRPRTVCPECGLDLQALARPAV